MVTLLLIEVRRYVRATAAPGLVLAAVLIAPGVIDRASASLSPAADRVVVAAWACALAAVVARLIRAIVVAALQPRRDRRASERLQVLRDRSHAPGHMLVAIQHVTWIGTAGQRVHALDVTRGTLHDLWLSEVALPVGSFAVLDLTMDPVRVIDWLDARAVAKARRHDSLRAARQQQRVRRAERIATRRQRHAAAEVVREAERLLGRR